MVTLDEKLESVSRRELADLAMDASARNVAAYSKMLLVEFGKEKAMEVIHKHRFDEYYKVGKKNAERAGEEKVKKLETLAEPPSFDSPFVVPREILELTETRYRTRTTGCLMGKAILRLNLDQDLLDLVKLWCVHDFGMAEGWNPEIKFRRTKFMLDGDDYCEFEFEMDK